MKKKFEFLTNLSSDSLELKEGKWYLKEGIKVNVEEVEVELNVSPSLDLISNFKINEKLFSVFNSTKRGVVNLKGNLQVAFDNILPVYRLVEEKETLIGYILVV